MAPFIGLLFRRPCLAKHIQPPLRASSGVLLPTGLQTPPRSAPSARKPDCDCIPPSDWVAKESQLLLAALGLRPIAWLPVRFVPVRLQARLSLPAKRPCHTCRLSLFLSA